mgnify:CR=1 FL=1
MKRYTLLILTILISSLFLACQEDQVRPVTFLAHSLDFTINIENSSASFTDRGQMEVIEGANLLYLASDIEISTFTIDESPVSFSVLDSAGLFGINPQLATSIHELAPPSDALWVVFEYSTPGIVSFIIEYTGVFQEDVSDIKFSNQNVGREVTGTILERGAYFSPSSYYYPQGDDGLMSFEVTATIPATWESIADGNSVASVSSGQTKVQSWKNPYQNDGLMFMAAPFVVKHAKAGESGVDIYCYFFEEDTSLFETYLPATVDYMNMYSEMIGPYPYKRFTVAENFFPTGYGMPAWTLLGQRVIRMPFIVMTSLGHEVLHNWWGNSIYVDYDQGNWCEGLTVYGADYRYKLKRGPSSARDYRKDILKQYKSYVTEENEFPVRDFVSRHNAESRTIGYNKTMMIFHMIEELIGEKDFFQAWRNVYDQHQGQQVSWGQWIQAYEMASDQDLSFIIPQWVDRVGAARVAVKLIDAKFEKDSTRIKFEVEQTGGDIYNLRLPVKFYGVEGQDGVVELSDTSAIFEFLVAGEATAFEVDPDYNTFRHLYPEEIEATVAAAMGAPQKYFWYSVEAEKSVMKSFGDAIIEGDVTPVPAETPLDIGPADNFSVFNLNPSGLPADLARQVKMESASISIDGTSFPRKGHTFVLSGEDKTNAAKTLIIISENLESLPRIGELIPHYGKYSYLVFKGSRNVAKGQWPALASPLRINL